ncbi:zinc transporter ZIP9 [Neocloeon triangulifer]|uniref:zinc transporter ZIP9 n=1 Tax=Neocloeon triangulifer TaxID=2078957 RepID=UPI00286F2480|nr:zinc transporter ZIP9 [Neocloeon triangulifer]
MDETTKLVFLSLLMLVGSYLSGSIPLTMSLSQESLQMVSVLGAGLLVGTALSVIIPEGVRSLLSVPHAHEGNHEGSGGVVNLNEHSDEGADVHSLIGVSLVLGFVFMLLVDQLSAKRGDSENKTEKSMTATVGLVVHAAADGIALGAAATTAHTDVEMIVFIAIMLHKAPAAFGLVTFLMHEGLERNRIRKHLIIFSVSAPLLAVVTYFGLGQDSKETLSSVNATGLAMLFSAGTFLYVATVHVLPELTQRSHSHAYQPVSPENGAAASHGKTLRLRELFFLVVGTLLPLMLAVGHHH